MTPFARTLRPATRAPEILVDYLDVAPPQLSGAVPERVLPASALLMLSNLAGRRLSDVNPGRTRQVLRRHSRHDRPLPAARPGSSSPPARAPREARPGGPAAPRLSRSSGSPARTALPVSSFFAVASTLPPSSGSFAGRKNASITARNADSASRGNAGTSRTSKEAARGLVIHSGR